MAEIISDMELMNKMVKFARKSHQVARFDESEIHHREELDFACDKSHRPPFDRPPHGDRPPFDMPPHGDRPPFDMPPHGDRPPFDIPPHGDRPPFDMPPHAGRPPFDEPGHHCMKRPPLSRERLLVLVGEKSDGIRQKELVQKTGIGQSSVSELINKLEDDGYIERKIDPSDKRATLLFLTEKGQARAMEVEDERNEFFSDIFSKITDEEKKTLSDILDKLLSD